MFIEHLGYLFFLLFGTSLCNLGDFLTSSASRFALFSWEQHPFRILCMYSWQVQLFLELRSVDVVASGQYYSN